jgi:hypothetical protein
VENGWGNEWGNGRRKVEKGGGGGDIWDWGLGFVSRYLNT